MLQTLVLVVAHWTCFSMSHFFLFRMDTALKMWYYQSLRYGLSQMWSPATQSPPKRPWKMDDPSFQIGPWSPAATGGVLLGGTACTLLWMVGWMAFPPTPLVTAGVFITRWFIASACDWFTPCLLQMSEVSMIYLCLTRDPKGWILLGL